MSQLSQVPIGQIMAVHPAVEEALSSLGFSDLSTARGATSPDLGIPLAEACRRRNIGIDRVLLAIERAGRDAGIVKWPDAKAEPWPGPGALVVEVLERVPGSHDAFHELGVHPCQCFNMTVAEAARKFGARPEELLARLRKQ